ncbi:MAG: flagellar hook-associated protein FlgK [Spirochaetes bacterium]|nr:flagellar hook-associated protein FlgK [Spirochaetota bacterium]
MNSTFMGIEIGKRGIMAHNQALLTTGHNLTNASTEGYSRQRVEFGAFEPLYAPELNREETPGQIGQGVIATRIERVRDMLLEGRIVAQDGTLGYWNTADKYMSLVEQVYDEPTEVSVRSQMDRFWDSWQELSLHPSELPARRAVVERGQGFIDSVHERFRRLEGIRDMADQDIRVIVKQVNSLSIQIAGLNEEIVKVRAVGDNPNDLLDRRDLLVEKLAELVPVTTDGRDKDEFMIHVNGQVLVQGRIARTFNLTSGPENDGYGDARWADTGSTMHFEGGTLGALFEMRDVVVRGEIQSLDTMTMTFTDLVNEVHSSAYGLNGKTGTAFFAEYPMVNNVVGNYDRNGDGAFDSTYLYRMTGANRLSPQEQVGLEGTITLSGRDGDVQVSYRPTDTIGQIVDRINNSGAEVTARLDRNYRLELRAAPSGDKVNPDFVIRHVEDSGEFLSGYSGMLAGSGPAAAYDWAVPDAALGLRAGAVDWAVAPLSHPAGWIEVSLDVKRDLSSVAAGFGDNGNPAAPGDGRAALEIAALRDRNVMVGALKTFDDFFADSVARVGLMGERAGMNAETQSRIVKNLTDMRESLSGVNMDEELSNMIKFQHGYAAAAKFITVFDSMLDTIINRMGV